MKRIVLVLLVALLCATTVTDTRMFAAAADTLVRMEPEQPFPIRSSTEMV